MKFAIMHSSQDVIERIAAARLRSLESTLARAEDVAKAAGINAATIAIAASQDPSYAEAAEVEIKTLGKATGRAISKMTRLRKAVDLERTVQAIAYTGYQQFDEASQSDITRNWNQFVAGDVDAVEFMGRVQAIADKAGLLPAKQ